MATAPEHRAFLQFRQHRDPAALGEVFDRTAPKLLLCAAHLARPGIDPQDLLQSTFLAAIENADAFDSRQPLLPWLVGILTHRAREQSRQAARRPDPSRLRPETPVDPFAATSDREFSRAFTDAVERLLPEQRRAIVLHLVHGLSSTEIAHIEGCPPATIKSRIQRARELVRQALPAGFAAAALGITTSSLAATRASLLATVPVATSSATVLGGGTLLMKKLLLGIAAASLAAFAAMFAPIFGADPDAASVQVHVPPELQARSNAPSTPPGVAGESKRHVVHKHLQTRMGNLQVRAQWPDGSPAPGVAVHVRPETGVFPSNVARSRITDADGSADLGQLPAGQTWLVAAAEAGAVPVVLRPGNSNNTILTLHRTGTVRGIVVTPDGAPLGGAHVFVTLDMQDPLGGDTGLRSAADGSFELATWTRWLSVHARLPGHAPSDTAFLRLAEDGTASVRLVVGGPVAAVRGSVQFHGTPPRTGGRVWLYPRRTRTEPRPAQRTGPRFAAARVTTLADDHSFAFLDVPPGAVVLKVLAPSFGLVRLERTVPAGTTLDLSVELWPGASLTGVVSDADDKPVAGARVWVNGIFASSSRVDTTGPDGRFKLDCLPVGSYRVSALHQKHGRAVVTRSSSAGETATWNPQLVESGVIRGRVTNAVGSPLAGWRVRRRLGDEAVPTSAEGRFELPARRGVWHQVQIFEPGHPETPRAAVTRALAGGEDLHITVTDASALRASVTGRLTSLDGKPVRGQQLRLQHHATGFDTMVAEFDGDGRFAVRSLPSGRYTVRVQAPDLPLAIAAECELLLDQVTDVGELRLIAAVPTTLRVRRVPAAQPATRHHVHVSVLDPKGHFIHSGRARVHAGRLDLPPLPPGPWRIQVGGPDVVWVERQIVLRAGQPFEDTIELHAGAPVAIRFEDANPVAGTVRIRGYLESGRTSFDVHLDQALARFGLDIGLPPGRIRIAAETSLGKRGEAWIDVTPSGTTAALKLR